MSEDKPLYLVNEDSEINQKIKSFVGGGKKILHAFTNEADFTALTYLYDGSLKPVCRAVATNIAKNKIKREGVAQKIAALCAKNKTKALLSGGFFFTQEEKQALMDKKIILYDGSTLIKAKQIAECYKKNGINAELGIIGGNEDELFCLSRIFNYLKVYPLDSKNIFAVRENIYRENGTVITILPYMAMLKACEEVLDLSLGTKDAQKIMGDGEKEFLFDKNLNRITADISYCEYKVASKLSPGASLNIEVFTDYFCNEL